MNKHEFAFVVYGLVLGIMIGLIIGGCLVEKRFKNMAIEKGHAEYNQTTGKFQWKEIGK